MFELAKAEQELQRPLSRAATTELLEDAIELERSRAASEELEDALLEAARTHAAELIEAHERALCDAYATIRSKDLLIDSLRADNSMLLHAFRLERLELERELESLHGQLLSAAVTPSMSGAFDRGNNHACVALQEQAPIVPARTTKYVEHVLPLLKAKPTASKAQPRTSAAKRGVSARAASLGSPLAPQQAERLSPAHIAQVVPSELAATALQANAPEAKTCPFPCSKQLDPHCKLRREQARQASVSGSLCTSLADSDTVASAHADWMASMLLPIRDLLRFAPLTAYSAHSTSFF
jgi:hypothetical protein